MSGNNLNLSLKELTESLIIKDSELKESEKKFSALFCINPLPICVSIAVDGTLLEVNDAYLKIFQYTREEIIGKSTIELGIVDAKERETFSIEMCSKGFIQNKEMSLKRKDGTILTALISIKEIILNKIKCWLVVVIDITHIREEQQKTHLAVLSLIRHREDDLLEFTRRNEDNLTDFTRHEEDYEIKKDKKI
jgi:PAS domain S-box-containing protein